MVGVKVGPGVRVGVRVRADLELTDPKPNPKPNPNPNPKPDPNPSPHPNPNPNPNQERLRADLLDFCRSQLKPKTVGGAGRAGLSGRAVARIFHKMTSPAYPRQEWKENRYWGKHAGVAFEAVRQMAEEALETVRRANLASMKEARKRQ